jgi:hypothetical protein
MQKTAATMKVIIPDKTFDHQLPSEEIVDSKKYNIP